MGPGGLEVIRFEGDEDAVTWRHPADDVTIYSRIVVQPGQEAVFVLEGRISQIYGPGTHTLSSGNIPFVKRIYSLAFGGRTPIPAEVVYIRKARIVRKWGTSGPIQVQVSSSGMASIRAHGAYHVCIRDARTFLHQFPRAQACSVNDLDSVFRPIVVTRLSDLIAETLQGRGIPAGGINSSLDELSKAARERLVTDFHSYGFELMAFFVESITIE